MFLKKFRKKSKVTVGSVEKISLPELGIKNLTVRVDTGASLSALHAENIRYKKRRALQTKSTPCFNQKCIKLLLTSVRFGTVEYAVFINADCCTIKLVKGKTVEVFVISWH